MSITFSLFIRVILQLDLLNTYNQNFLEHGHFTLSSSSSSSFELCQVQARLWRDMYLDIY